MKNTSNSKGKTKSDFDKGFRIAALRKIMRGAMKKYFWFFVGRQSKKLLKDCQYFPEELIDYLMITQSQEEEKIIKDINDWLHLETSMTGNQRVKYLHGQGKELFSKIRKQRELFLVLGSN